MVPNFWEHIARQELIVQGQLLPDDSKLSKSDFDKMGLLLEQLRAKLEEVPARLESLEKLQSSLVEVQQSGKICYGCGFCQCGRGSEADE